MFRPEVAFIMRDDDVIKDFRLKRITVDTSFGPVDRCFIGSIYGVDVLIIYGRFNGQKVPSNMINYQQNIEVVKNMNCKNLIGTFVVGGISPSRKAGTTYILGDLVGMGNYSISVNQQFSFHNAEMFKPFCETITERLKEASKKMSFDVILDAVYVCFHGWPRIETKAELSFYNKMGWDIVGQTCDPEATSARLAGLCYAGIAVQIDDPLHREDVISNIETCNSNLHSKTIREYRKNTTAMVLQFLREYSINKCEKCARLKRTNNSFKEFPGFMYE